MRRKRLRRSWQGGHSHVCFHFQSNKIAKMRDWPQAKFPTPLDFVPLGVSLSEGLFLSVRGSVRVQPGLEE